MASNQRNRGSQGTRATNKNSAGAVPEGTPGRLGQWRQNYERYKSLAESAGNADAVTREGYWQNAEHFIRLINAAAAVQTAPSRMPTDQREPVVLES